ncbi:MAG TPA: TetR/AcrR family transcriptional regulator [Acidimicrobiales bacterium]|nr:TetR/AcrR family transcriptional regulator [Acidimicrobiales bacterium]
MSGRAPRTQQARKATTRASLLAAASELFADKGIDAVSVDAVAAAAGRTSGAIYAHFASKEGLVLAVLDDLSQSLVTVIAAEFELAAGLEQRLGSVAANVIVRPSDATRRLLLLEAELSLLASRNERVAKALRRRRRQADARMTRGLQAWIAEGILPRRTRAESLATGFRAMVVGLAMAQRLDATLDEAAVTVALASALGLDLATSTGARSPTL